MTVPVVVVVPGIRRRPYSVPCSPTQQHGSPKRSNIPVYQEKSTYLRAKSGYDHRMDRRCHLSQTPGSRRRTQPQRHWYHSTIPSPRGITHPSRFRIPNSNRYENFRWSDRLWHFMRHRWREWVMWCCVGNRMGMRLDDGWEYKGFDWFVLWVIGLWEVERGMKGMLVKWCWILLEVS